MVNKLGLRQEIDSRLHLLKKHLSYHESDHVLNLTCNALLEGMRLEDIELRRNDETFLDGLGAPRIPDPTTSEDFTVALKRLTSSISWPGRQPARYLFYITNRVDYTSEQIVSLANGRCNQENVIEQLKNGVNAMRMPMDDLLSNWAYMVMTLPGLESEGVVRLALAQ